MKQKIVHKHSYRLFDDLQLSSNEFYTSLETLITQYQFPNVTVQRVNLQTNGWLSERREYLQISRGEFHYYVCAAPFGRSFFISWWYREEEEWLNKQLRKNALYRALFIGPMQSFFRQDALLVFTHAIDAIVGEAVGRIQPEQGNRTPSAVLVAQQVP